MPLFPGKAIFEILRNAFIQAWMPRVDNEINIPSVEEEEKKDDRSFLQRIFGKKDRDKNDDKGVDKKDAPNKEE